MLSASTKILVTRSLIIVLVCILSSCTIKKVHFESPSGPLSRSVTLKDDLLAYFSSSDVAVFNVTGGLTPPLHDCHTAVLTGVALNSPDNLRMPSEKTSLEYRMYCLKCTSNSGRTFTRKVAGLVTGKELRGEHIRIYGIDRTQNRYGLTVKAGAIGVAEVENVSSVECDWISG